MACRRRGRRPHPGDHARVRRAAEPVFKRGPTRRTRRAGAGRGASPSTPSVTCGPAAAGGPACAATRTARSCGRAASTARSWSPRLVFTFAWDQDDGRPGHETLVTRDLRRGPWPDADDLPPGRLPGRRAARRSPRRLDQRVRPPGGALAATRTGEARLSAIAATVEPDDRVLVITRVLDAPRPLVFACWTDARQLAQWWGPRGFTVVSCEADVRVGGAWRVETRSPEGERAQRRRRLPRGRGARAARSPWPGTARGRRAGPRDRGHRGLAEEGRDDVRQAVFSSRRRATPTTRAGAARSSCWPSLAGHGREIDMAEDERRSADPRRLAPLSGQGRRRCSPTTRPISSPTTSRAPLRTRWLGRGRAIDSEVHAWTSPSATACLQHQPEPDARHQDDGTVVDLWLRHRGLPQAGGAGKWRTSTCRCRSTWTAASGRRSIAHEGSP